MIEGIFLNYAILGSVGTCQPLKLGALEPGADIHAMKLALVRFGFLNHPAKP